MKKLYLYIIALCCLNITSCNFLEETSQDEVRPSTVDDLVQLMLGEGYGMSYDFLAHFEYLTDDVQSRYPNPTDYSGLESLDKFKAVYLWDTRMADICDEKGVNGYNYWQYIYQRIMGCNVVLSMIDKVSGGHEARENLRGQALAMRAFYYFTLANIYSMPYTSGNPDEIEGVPVITEPQLTDSYPARAKISKVYDQIISDLETAHLLLNQYGLNNITYRATGKSATALLSRVYLYMGEWAKSIEYSSQIIEKFPQLQRIANYIEVIPHPEYPEFFPPTLQPDLLNNVYSAKSIELIWGYGISRSTTDFYPLPTPGSDPAWSASEDLKALYANDNSGAKDCRKEFFFTSYLVGFDASWNLITEVLTGDKGNRTNSASQGIRTAEIYLNRAEANIMLAIDGKGGDLSQALSDINTLREARFDTKSSTYTPISITDSKELLKFYRDERRRELAFERHRWFDIRRWGLLGFSHTIEIEKGQKQTKVFDNSKQYALPIPQEVLDRNPSIKQNLY